MTREARAGASLLALKGRAFLNAVTHAPKAGLVVLFTLAALLVWAEVYGTLRALRFLDQFGSVGLAVFQRVLEVGLVVLSAGVTFSAITTAILTLYLSDDLNFLLTQPLRSGRVFTLKVFETYLTTALVPTGLTLPILAAVGAFFHAPAWYYPVALIGTVLVYALPVGLGALIAVFLMRVAPVGRVREVATALGVLLSAALVYAVRAVRPEVIVQQLTDARDFEAFLERFALPDNPLMPAAWAAVGFWTAARGGAPLTLIPLAVLAVLVLAGATALAAFAYQAGWARNLDSSRVRLDPRPRGPSRVERFAARFGPGGVLAMKDARLLLRDPTQWSQLLILVALGGVYVVSVRSFPQQLPLFQNIVGYVQLAFQGFVIAGVGVRLAFPGVSLEGRAYWLLRTSPMTARQIVLSKYAGALPPTLVLALILSVTSALALDLSPVIVFASVLVAVSSALVTTALGVALGAVAPRFTADNPAEIGVSPAGLTYMLVSVAYTLALLAVLARPAYASVYLPDVFPGLTYFATPLGLLALAGVLACTVLGTVLPLRYGWSRLDRHE